MRSTTIFSGKVSETDFNNWNNGINKEKMLYFGYDDEDDGIVKFCSPDEGMEYMKSQPDFEEMQEMFEEDECPDPEKELFNYYGFYATPKEFMKCQEENKGTYKYKSSGDGSGILKVSVNI